MDDEPSRQDKKLLERLNALKLSNVSLRSSSDHCTSAGALDADEALEDLVERIQRNHGRPHNNDKRPFLTGSPVHKEDGPPSPPIEELLAGLDPDNQHMLESSNMRKAQVLLAEAKSLLPNENKGSIDVDHTKFTQKSVDRSISPSRDKTSEECEAEAARQRIINEAEYKDPPEAILEYDKNNRSLIKSSENLAPIKSFSALQFPSTPDRAFSSLVLPSVPTTVASRETKAKAIAKPNHPGFSDQEIESWCVICCGDASVLCLGCNKDVYCRSCWRGGHMGEGAGLGERGHVWERFGKGAKSTKSIEQ